MLFVWSVLLIACQYWCAYESINFILMANQFPPLFLYAFYQCSFLQAYLWELCYLVNIGFIKAIFIIYTGVLGKRNFEDFFYYPRSHTYGDLAYWIAILGAIFLVNKYINMKDIIKEILEKHKKALTVITITELCIVGMLTNMGQGRAREKDLAEVLIVFSMFIFFLVMGLIRLSKQMEATEKRRLKSEMLQ